MNREYYSNTVSEFIKTSNDEIFGQITKNDEFSAGDLQKNTWIKQIQILKEQLSNFKDGYIIFEYTVPRIGSRIDNVFIYQGIIFIFEFKVGESEYKKSDLDQVVDYGLDLSYFHHSSHNRTIVPVLISTKASDRSYNNGFVKDNIMTPYLTNGEDLERFILNITSSTKEESLNPIDWINSIYRPTPTIIEAAIALYNNHDVKEITNNEASKINLTKTTQEINRIINYSKNNNRKSICFITGVPGAGKTLAGLNIAIDRQMSEGDTAVFLSGNGPLVNVLQEALARDYAKKHKTSKKEGYTKSKTFIQNIHHFRNDALSSKKATHENIAIFDESQRAWDQKKLSKYMREKKGITEFDISEPEFLISIMDRHEDWTTVICLVGGGQEIHTGESAGISGWLDALNDNYNHWDIYLSKEIINKDYIKEFEIDKLYESPNVNIVNDLHLSTSIRSFRSENVSKFVKEVLDYKPDIAKETLITMKYKYPVVLTRNIYEAKNWVRENAKGTERFGITSSSRSKRLRKHGRCVKNDINPVVWFLNDKEDVRSSYYLEETATEFDVQGLELDYSIVCWGADLRMTSDGFCLYNFSGTTWKRINNTDDKLFLKNAYRVLLTRARQGLVIFVPEGDKEDPTALPEFYDFTYNYLKSIGIDEI